MTIDFIKKNRSLIYLLLIGLCSYFFSYFFNTIVTKIFPPDVFGDFSIALRSVFVISMLLLAGTNISSVKHLSNFINDDDHHGFNRFLHWNFRLIIKTFIISFVIFLLFYSLLILFHFISLKNIMAYHYSVYAFWLAPFAAFYVLLASFLLSLKQNNYALFFNKLAANILLTLFLAITVLVFDLSVHYFTLLVILLISFCVIIVIELFIIRGVLSRKKISLNLKRSLTLPVLDERKNWIKDSVNFTSVQTVYYLTFVLDLLILYFIHPNESTTGYYAAMLVIVTVFSQVSQAITSYLAPEITPLIKKKKYHELQKMINTTNLINLPSLALLFMVIVFFFNALLSLFGPGYDQAQLPLIILSAGYLLGASAMANARILMFLDSKTILIINVSEIIILIISGVLLTYYFGLIGMSCSVLISISAKTALMFYQLKKRLPIKPYSLI